MSNSNNRYEELVRAYGGGLNTPASTSELREYIVNDRINNRATKSVLSYADRIINRAFGVDMPMPDSVNDRINKWQE